ncbi:MAG: PAS domain S-box protein [Pedobacter sp.]|nr:PAS domain S-box protein [Pedobacter sp.]MDQ8051587.1 PAS domain S-box protein [Pedobacter sp.]
MDNPLESLQQIIAISPMPTALVDTQMRYLAVSEKWISFYRLEGLELIGKSHYDIFPEIGERWKKVHRDCLNGIDQTQQNDRFERKDGTVMYLKWEVRHWKNQGGEIAGMMMTSEDVTQTTDTIINENRFQLFMDRLPGMSWIIGSDDSLVYANQNFISLLQLDPNVIGQRLSDIFGKDRLDQSLADNELVRKTLQGMNFEYHVPDATGRMQTFRTYKFPFKDPSNEGFMIGAIAINITENNLLEEELNKSETQFELAFEHSLIGMALISPDGKLIRANHSLCEMLGYTEQEMVNLTVQGITYELDQDDTATMLADLGSGKIGRTKYEKRYLHKNGTIIWVVVAATMLYDQAGVPLYYVSQIEDITKRKEIENSLMLSEKKYRTIFENVQDVFYQSDQHGLVTEISPSIEEYSGFSRSEIIGKPVANFYYYPQDRERIIEQLRSDGYVIDFEVRLKTKNKELRYASVNARLVVENGVVMATEGSMRDVTARKFQENALKALNNELTASNDQKNKLLSIIGHDLRNPISGSLQLLGMTLNDLDSTSVDELHAYLSSMMQELSNANNLLEDLLAWAKSQFESASFNPVEIRDAQVVVEKCIQTILPMAAKKKIDVVLDVPPGLSFSADKAMLETIFRNLLSNAVKFTPIGGKVFLSAVPEEGGIKFSVRDSGIGIPADKIPHLFGKNTSFTTFGTSGEKGTGLGLGLCSDFVARHQGMIWAESELGKGTTIFFVLPR